MDRQSRSLILACVLGACFAASAAAQRSISIRELSWLSGENQVEALTVEPHLDQEELRIAAASGSFAQDYENAQDLADDLRLGEALFKTPLLLGGQAAKAGLSCNSCHVNGRDNPHFLFPAISQQPGTADTTHNFFSETLGNGVFDPVPIPDLAQGGKVSHDVRSRDLERFLRTIVEQEFAGAKPADDAIPALATFVRALRLMPASEVEKTQRKTIASDLDDAVTAVRLAQGKAGEKDVVLARLLLSGARSQLATIHERLLPELHSAERSWLARQSRALGDIQALLREDGGARDDRPRDDVKQAFSDWFEGFAGGPDFVSIEEQSLYDPDVLSRFLSSDPIDAGTQKGD